MAANCRYFTRLALGASFDASIPCDRTQSVYFSSPAPKLLYPSHSYLSIRFRIDRDPTSTNFASMMIPSTTFALLLFLYVHIIACDDILHARVACSSSYTACNPKGAATTNEPPIGTGLSSLFIDVVDTLDSANLAKRESGQKNGLLETRASGGGLCCEYLASMTDIVAADRH